MKTNGFRKIYKRNRKLALILALFLCFSLCNIVSQGNTVFASQDSTETSDPGTSDPETTDPQTGYQFAGGAEEEIQNNILSPSTSVISFWEWEKLSKSNYERLLKDGKFHAALFTIAGSNTNQFLSTYADENHIFTSRNTMEWGGVDTNFQLKSLRDLYGLNDWGAAIGKAIGSHGGDFDQYRSIYIKADDMGKNKIPTDYPNKFFSSNGGCMGCLWIKLDSDTQSYSLGVKMTLITAKCQVAMTRGSAYGNSKDTSYLSIGTGLNQKEDFFLYCQRYEGDDGEHYEPVQALRHTVINDLPDQDCWTLFLGEDSNYGYFQQVALANFRKNEGWHPGDDNDKDYTFLTYAGGYILPIIEDHGGNEIYDCLYIGTPHNFTALETHTIPAEKLEPISNNTFLDTSNDISNFEGGILPKGQKITVEGTLVVSGNLINNGTIDIKKGGTLLIKDGGCISPYMKDAEGVIINNGGNIIIMEGGSCYCCYSEGNSNYTDYCPLKMTNGGTIINYGTLSVSSSQIATGCKIENRKDGSFYCGYNRKDINTMFYTAGTDNLQQPSSIRAIPSNAYYHIVNILDGNASIQINNGGLFGAMLGSINIKSEDLDDFAAVSRKHSGNADEMQTDLEALCESKGYLESVFPLRGIGGVVDTDRPTVVNEKTAHFYHTTTGNVDTAPTTRVDYVEPEY